MIPREMQAILDYTTEYEVLSAYGSAVSTCLGVSCRTGNISYSAEVMARAEVVFDQKFSN